MHVIVRQKRLITRHLNRVSLAAHQCVNHPEHVMSTHPSGRKPGAHALWLAASSMQSPARRLQAPPGPAADRSPYLAVVAAELRRLEREYSGERIIKSDRR